MNNKNLQIQQILTLAFENHKKNNFKLAESLYKKILKIDSDNQIIKNKINNIYD